MTMTNVDLLTEYMIAGESPASVVRGLVRDAYEALAREMRAQGLDVEITSEDIDRATDWTIREARIAWDEADALRDNPQA